MNYLRVGKWEFRGWKAALLFEAFLFAHMAVGFVFGKLL
jgi:hypothetical protein